ncbi:hypothetical protein HMPREF1985_00951 [Mitsuokella sp. oral taxon 131 str. W9106]|nr:hypothetical protein HMPREF1985_00951 [Mitsuokella sp. oral taxon 131 str. W9106]
MALCFPPHCRRLILSWNGSIFYLPRAYGLEILANRKIDPMHNNVLDLFEETIIL